MASKKPTTNKVTSRKTTGARRARSSSGARTAYTKQVTLLTAFFTLCSLIFAAMAYYSYAV